MRLDDFISFLTISSAREFLLGVLVGNIVGDDVGDGVDGVVADVFGAGFRSSLL